MLLRYSYVQQDLLNGTPRLIIKMCKNTLEFAVITGIEIGRRGFIPKFNLFSSDSTLPFSFERRPLPIRVASCMTIYQAQGQTLDTVGVHLTTPVFSMGCSMWCFLEQGHLKMQRYKSRRGGGTKNMMWKDVFQNIFYKSILFIII